MTNASDQLKAAAARLVGADHRYHHSPEHATCNPDDCDVALAAADTTARELPRRRPGRAARIAAIHMFADWLVAHPDVPVPEITATYGLTPLEEPDETTRVQEIGKLAERLGAREYGTGMGGNPQFDFVVADRLVHGIEIIYRGFAVSDARWNRDL